MLIWYGILFSKFQLPTYTTTDFENFMVTCQNQNGIWVMLNYCYIFNQKHFTEKYHIHLTDYLWMALRGVGPRGWCIFFLLAPDDCLCMRIKTLQRFLVKSVTRYISGHFKPQKWTFYRMIHFFTEVCQKLRIDE